MTRWELDRRIAARLGELGRCGVGGFDEEGVRSDGTRFDDWLATDPPAATAVTMLATLADAAAACEQRALFPGAIDVDQLCVRDGRIELRADALVEALAGKPHEAAPVAWLPPEYAGRTADNASNRYAIGLVAYRVFAGEHPFAGRGLRLGLEDQARGAPPFSPERAAGLPPGLQSLCLRMLDPDPAMRPASAAAIAAALRGVVGASRSASRPSPSQSNSEQEERSERSEDLSNPRVNPAVESARTSQTDRGSTDRVRVLEHDLESSEASERSELSGRSGQRAARSVADPALGRAARGTAPAESVRPRAAATVATAGTQTAAGRRTTRSIVALAPIVIGVSLAAVAIGAIRSPADQAVAAAPARALVAPRELADCASCHPRQSAEWSRSVMAHAVESPLFQSLEMLIEEQVGRDRQCPNGAGTLRAAGASPCTNPRTGLPVTGSGGALWCVNCHAPGENLAAAMPAWEARSSSARTRRPLRDLLPPQTMEGISCAACHQMTGPAHPGAAYEGNPSWISPDTGVRFLQRPEDQRGVFGIGNSGYLIDPRAMTGEGELVPGGAHRRTSAATAAYQRSSEMCGACHDVRLFGTDAITGVERGEHFKRLRNAYSEWATWAGDERRAGRQPASCQDCHMSLYPGICEPSPGAARKAGCPEGTALAARAPGNYPTGHGAAGAPLKQLSTHYFSGVDVPLAAAFDPAAVDDGTLDVAGIPVGAHQRRDMLLASAFRFAIDPPRAAGGRLEIPVVVENIGAGHRVPAGFSQEREIWVHLRVTDGKGRLVYEVGRIDRGDQDLRDKVFLRVNTGDAILDRAGRPLGLFGADVADGPDVPKWTAFGGDAEFRGRGLVNFQNGFLRCVTCIGTIDAAGQCQAAPGQEARRADRFADGGYDADTGECRSNLKGTNAFIEVFFPIGALDATRGVAKGPDAIVDTRSLAPNAPHRYTYDLDAAGAVGPFTVEATLEFRAFPPYLVRAFLDYEAAQTRAGLRPSGPLVDRAVLDRLDVVHVATARAVIP
ncbi:MAG: hypothetical protein ABI867_39420 [Kofleriaceae bacterium]